MRAADDPNVKQCRACGDLLPRARFPRRKTKDGRHHTCAACTKAASVRRGKDPAVRRERREKRLQRAYGISHRDYIRLGAQQRWRCAICGKPTSEVGPLVVDHDHDLGSGNPAAVRRLLCRGENSALGHFGDRSERLDAGADYLRAHGK
ncbi:endonuclease domain-containing protein [Kitasatospora purpeofusca]|uniref:endonuclease domain-containing protein n=1 Tax=Kitasatospora purpeofusca TaxID=67352 RepID=UPI00368204AC